MYVSGCSYVCVFVYAVCVSVCSSFVHVVGLRPPNSCRVAQCSCLVPVLLLGYPCYHFILQQSCSLLSYYETSLRPAMMKMLGWGFDPPVCFGHWVQEPFSFTHAKTGRVYQSDFTPYFLGSCSVNGGGYLALRISSRSVVGERVFYFHRQLMNDLRADRLDGLDVHHGDHSRLNNDSSNLKVLSHREHAKIHAAARAKG